MLENIINIVIQGFQNGERITEFRLKSMKDQRLSAIKQDKHYESRLKSWPLQIARHTSRSFGQLAGYRNILRKS